LPENVCSWFLPLLRKACRRAGTIWLLDDRASGHIAQATLALVKELRIKFVWLPKQRPELNAMDQLWKELKRDVVVETIIGHIKEFSSLRLPKHRSVFNAFTHITAALVACQINPLPPKPIRAAIP
jgi:hypothetical protein